MPCSAMFRSVLLVTGVCNLAFLRRASAARLYMKEETELTFNESLEERGEGTSGILPVAVLQAGTSISWLWAGSSTVRSVHNVYIALEEYRARRTLHADIVSAFVHSRIVALEEALKHQEDGEALAEIFSVDSLSALRTFADTSTRIASMCATQGWNVSGTTLQHHADHAQEVYDQMRGKVCHGLAREVQEQAKRANAIALEYWRGVSKPEVDGFKKTLYFETAIKDFKVYVRDMLDEFDHGVARDDEIGIGDFEKDCQPEALGSCSADAVETSSRRVNVGDDDPDQTRSLAQEFEHVTGNIRLLLQGLEDADCPTYAFDQCSRRAMRCMYGARTMLNTLEADWEAKEDIDEDDEQLATGSWLFHQIAKSGIRKVGLLGLANLVGTIARWLYRFRESISNLLQGVGWQTHATREIWKLLWTHGVRRQGNFIQRFLGGKLLNAAAAQVPNLAKGIVFGQIPIMANWLQSFTWLAIKRARSVNVSDACDKAAQSLQNGEHVDIEQAELMAMNTIQSN